MAEQGENRHFVNPCRGEMGQPDGKRDLLDIIGS